MRLAIIDLGTNTFNLLVAERSGGRLHIVHEEERAVFLGQGGIEHGLITPEAMERGLDTLRAFATTAREHGAERIIGIGTSALRNARNAHAFLDAALATTNVPIRIVSGDEEAELILLGARQAVTFTVKPMLVMDIGGGSIEFILATDRALMWKRSFEIGATRLRERFAPSDPISFEEQFRLAAFLDARLEPLFALMDRHWPTTLVGSAGSFDTLAAMMASARDVPLDDAVTLSVPANDFDRLKEAVLDMPREQRLNIPGMPAYRVDTIQLALVAMERVLMHGIEEIRWSRYALKEGAADRALSASTT